MTTPKTASHYNLVGHNGLRRTRLGAFESLQDALDYRDLIVGTEEDEVWAVFTDGSSKRVA